MIRVLLADDHKILRQGLARLLESEPDIEVVGEAEDGQTAVEMAIETQPDVVVMDVSMPHCNGIDATRGMTAEVPHARVIALSMYEGEGWASKLRAAGAAAYLPKDAAIDHLVSTIRDCFAAGTMPPK